MRRLCVFVFLLFLRESFGWDRNGHALIASIAQDLLSQKAWYEVNERLPLSGKGNLASIASWADQVKRSDPKYEFSRTLHFYDMPNSDPPEHCNRLGPDNRACAQHPTWANSRTERFDVSCAIRNYTYRLSHFGANTEEAQEALRFLVHFVGDSHQPLHLTGKYGGGRKVRVKLYGEPKSYNFHWLWDSVLLKRRMYAIHRAIGKRWQKPQTTFRKYLLAMLKMNVLGDAKRWGCCTDHCLKAYSKLTIPDVSPAKNIQHKLATGYNFELSKAYGNCHERSLGSGESYFFDLFNEPDGQPCSDYWASQIHQVNCKYIFPDSSRGKHGSINEIPVLQLPIHYEKNINKDLVLESLILSAGWRLAYVLNNLFDPKPCT